MPDLRPTITRDEVSTLLDQFFAGSVNDLTNLDGGEVARAFTFNAGTPREEYVLRLNDADHMPISFAKEARLAQTIASPAIPIPPIKHEGRWEHFYFAISRRVPGVTLDQLPPAEIKALMPAVLDGMDAIHSVDISQFKGYGIFNEQGRGLFPDWRSSLLTVSQEEEDWDYFGKWHHLFEDTFLERDLFEALFRKMNELLAFCPTQERWLVQNGLTMRNILAHDGKLTGIVDWIDAQYGDFVRDIAVLDFWLPFWNMRDVCLSRYQQRGLEIPNYNERLLCYQCHLCLDGLRFYAKQGRYDSYQWLRERCVTLLQTTI